MKNILIGAVAAAVLLLGGLYTGLHLSQSQTLGDATSGGSGGNVRYTKAPTNSIASCSTASTLVLATSTARQYVAIVNDSATTTYLGLGVAAVGSNGIRLNANGGSYELDANNLFTGAIYCISSSTSATVTTVASQ